MSDHVNIFGLTVCNESMDDAIQRAVHAARSKLRQIVFFINAHCINIAVSDPAYLQTLLVADQIYADGVGMRFAIALCGERLADNVNGTDLFPRLCETAAREGVGMAMLGAKPGVAGQCARNMQNRLPGLQFPFVHDGYFKPEDEASLINHINESGAGILLVALGVPSQELWIARNAHRIRTPVILAVGGLFDFYSGLRRRAPWLLRQCGLEWSFRLAQEPRRLFRRYILGNPLFLMRTFLLRLSGKEVLAGRVRVRTRS